MLDITLELSQFPIHRDNNLQTYNIYHEHQTQGLNDSIILEEPAIRSGCQTTCYFDALKVSQKYYSSACENCQNQNKRYFLDVGYKLFLNKHKKYIMVNNPLNVEINPNSKEFIFSSLSNTILSQLTNHISRMIIKELSINESVCVSNTMLNYSWISKHLESVMSPVIKRKIPLLYSFCKYTPNSNDVENDALYILLFFLNVDQPIKAKIYLNQENKQNPCSLRTYIDSAILTFIGKSQILFMTVPTENKTQYYVSYVPQHLEPENQQIKFIHLTKEYTDPLSRLGAFVVVDQKHASVYVIGGHEQSKNDCLDYISCFQRCSWEKNSFGDLSFRSDIDKNYKVFQLRNLPNTVNVGNQNYTNNNPTNPNNSFLIGSTTNKSDSLIVIKNTSFLLYAYNQQDPTARQNQYREKKLPINKNFFSLGGLIKDPTVSGSHRFTNKPGARYLFYDAKRNVNPIVNFMTPLGKDHKFQGRNYVMLELPTDLKKDKRKSGSQCLVFGGRDQDKHLGLKSKDQKVSFDKIFLADIINLEKSTELRERFEFSELISEVNDNYSVMLYSLQKKLSYIRVNLPLKKPVPLGPQYENVFVHYLVVEYQIDTSMFSVQPGCIDSS